MCTHVNRTFSISLYISRHQYHCFRECHNSCSCNFSFWNGLLISILTFPNILIRLLINVTKSLTVEKSILLSRSNNLRVVWNKVWLANTNKIKPGKFFTLDASSDYKHSSNTYRNSINPDTDSFSIRWKFRIRSINILADSRELSKWSFNLFHTIGKFLELTITAARPLTHPVK